MHILVVDDKQEARYFLEYLLKENNYNISCAANGKEALGILHEKKVDVIISDILMPVMDGFQLCREVKKDEKLKRIPFIFYTATYVEAKDKEYGLKLGAVEFLIKPMPPQDFLDKLQEIIAKYKYSPETYNNEYEEKDTLKLYSERLVHKLEQKMLALEKEMKEREKIETKLKLANAELMKMKDNLEEKVNKQVQELRSKDKFILRSSRLLALGELLTNIAHRWRQPLAAIGAIIQDLEDAWNYDELDAKYLQNSIEKAMQQLDFLSHTINEFSEFFHKDTYIEKFNCKEITENAINIIYDRLNHRNIELKKDLEDVTIEGYKKEYSQIILNILNNAIFIIQTNKIRSGMINISLKEVNGHSELIICDNGGGIPKENMPKIFDPYFTTKQNDKGTGIGLYISQKMIENMGGRIEVSNKENGACFKIII